MGTILDEIVVFKRREIVERQARHSVADLEQAIADGALPRGFAAALRQQAATGPAVIAEIKRGSPSLGCIRPELDAPSQAKAYQAGGAAALSVLTDEHFFFARPTDFAEIREQVSLPMLRKDFMVDPWQLLESRAMGADCVLLILAVLSDSEAAALTEEAHRLGMDVLAETHTETEVKRALDNVPFDLLGINNRNLKTFHTREETTLELAANVPDRDQVVAESGLHTASSVERLWRSGIKRFLVGEAFVKSPDPRQTVEQFVTAHRTP